MIPRIETLLNLTLKGEMFNRPVKTEFDREDLFLPQQERESKHLYRNLMLL